MSKIYKRGSLFILLAVLLALPFSHAYSQGIKSRAKKAYIDPLVTVLVLQSYAPRSVRVISKHASGMSVILGAEKQTHRVCAVSASGPRLGIRCEKTETQEFRSATFEDTGGTVTVEVKDQAVREYRGKIIIEAGEDSLIIVNQLPLEDYITSVVGGELETPQKEAMKAQAVVARTYALVRRGSHGLYDFCDQTHCQLYRGVETEIVRAREAVARTRGQVIVYKKELADVYYHSTCGGHTSPPDPVWGLRTSAALPYLKGVDDGEYCAASPHYRWTAVFTPAQIRKLEIEGLQGALLRLRVAGTSPEGNVTKLEILTSTGTQTMTGYEFYRLVGTTLGWNLVKSTRFTTSEKNGRIIINGKGLGHSIGLCQWGAMGMSSKGKKYEEIIQHYFPGVDIKVWDGELPSRQ